MLNPDKSNEIKDSQFLNIQLMPSTFEVTKFLKLINIKELHPSNIYVISFTEDESKFEKSISIIALHCLNIFLQVFNLEFHFNLIIFSP